MIERKHHSRSIAISISYKLNNELYAAINSPARNYPTLPADLPAQSTAVVGNVNSQRYSRSSRLISWILVIRSSFNQLQESQELVKVVRMHHPRRNCLQAGQEQPQYLAVINALGCLRPDTHGY